MAIGVAASDPELAVALFSQACFDVENARSVSRWKSGSNERFIGALALSQAQQGCEKALKALSRCGLSLRRSEERRVRKECRSRWSPYH